MGVPNVQCQILTNTCRKADLEYRLLQITNDILRLENSAAALQEQVYSDVQAKNYFQGVATSEENQDTADSLATLLSSEFYVAYQAQLKIINSKETALNTEKTLIETQIKALETENDGLNKELETDLKRSVLST